MSQEKATLSDPKPWRPNEHERARFRLLAQHQTTNPPEQTEQIALLAQQAFATRLRQLPKKRKLCPNF